MKFDSFKNLDQFIELIPDPAFYKDIEGRYLYFNQKLLDFLGLTREQVINKSDYDIFSYKNASNITQIDHEIIQNNQNRAYEESIIMEADDDAYFYTIKQIIHDSNNQPIGLFCTSHEITLQKQYQFIDDDYENILKLIAFAQDITSILDTIVDLAEKRRPHSICSILLLDAAKQHLYIGSAPHLPDFYNEAVDGVMIGEKVGSCGSAAFLKQRVIVENIDVHENWLNYLPLTQRANLHSSWSEPIILSNGEVVGTFAMYTHKPSKPTLFELKLINTYAHLTSLAIEKFQIQSMLFEKEKQLLETTLQANAELQAIQDELNTLFQNALVGLMFITGERILIRANQRMADILGYHTPEDMVGLSMHAFHLTESRFIEFGQKNFYTLTEQTNFNIEYQLKRKDGTAIWCELSGKAIDTSTPADLSKGVLWSVNDISQRKHLEEQVQQRTIEIEANNTLLQELASKDHLTGLFNRSKLDESIDFQIKICRRQQKTFGLILIDIDFFKSVNDTYGHQTGDTVLIEFANLLMKISREIDIVGRWGGEEFMIVVENTNNSSLLVFAEKLRFAIENHTFSIVHNITASLGATLSQVDDTSTSIVSRVDTALYTAKKLGRNTVHIL